jgi:putative methionine-R-sulfoxide reductase with GAF domain
MPLAHHSAPASDRDSFQTGRWKALRDDLLVEESLPLQNTLVAIPELDAFDQADLNTNPVLNEPPPVPLVGALLVAEGRITREQLNACLLIQAQDHPDLPIGQILVRCGYISDTALDLALGTQADLKSSLVQTIEAQGSPPADLTALVLHQRGSELASAALRPLGILATVVYDWAAFTRALREANFDLALVGDTFLDETAVLPNQSMPFLIVPPIGTGANGGFALPPWSRAMIGHSVAQVRVQRQQRAASERFHQHEFELSAIAALSRSMSAASSSRGALTDLMRAIRDLFGVEAGTLYQFDRAAHALIFEIVLGQHQEELYQQSLPIDRGIAGWVVRHGEPLLIPDVRRDPRFEGMFDHQSGFQTRSVLCVPLLSRGAVWGVIQLINKLDGDFNERDLRLLRMLASLGALAAMSDAYLFERDLGQ